MAPLPAAGYLRHVTGDPSPSVPRPLQQGGRDRCLLKAAQHVYSKALSYPHGPRLCHPATWPSQREPGTRGQHSQGSRTGQGHPTGSGDRTPENLLVPKEHAWGGAVKSRAGLKGARCSCSRGLDGRPPERAQADSPEHSDRHSAETVYTVQLKQLSSEAAGLGYGYTMRGTHVSGRENETLARSPSSRTD